MTTQYGVAVETVQNFVQLQKKRLQEKSSTKMANTGVFQSRFLGLNGDLSQNEQTTFCLTNTTVKIIRAGVTPLEIAKVDIITEPLGEHRLRITWTHWLMSVAQTFNFEFQRSDLRDQVQQALTQVNPSPPPELMHGSGSWEVPSTSPISSESLED